MSRTRERSLSNYSSRTELARSQALARLSSDNLDYRVGNYESQNCDAILHSLNYFFTNLVDQASRYSILIYLYVINNIQNKPINTKADKETRCNEVAALTPGFCNQQFLNLLLKLLIQLKYLITLVENSTFDSIILRDVSINENEAYDSYSYLKNLQEVLNILEKDVMAPKWIKPLNSSQHEFKSNLPEQSSVEPIILEELTITPYENTTVLSSAPQYNNDQISTTFLTHISSQNSNLRNECNDILFVINFILPELRQHHHFCEGLRNILNTNNDAIEKLYMIIEHTTAYEVEEPRPIKKTYCYSNFFTCHSAKVMPKLNDKLKEFQDIMANIAIQEITEDSARHIKNNLRGLIEITAAPRSIL